jgi:hypothetical protein
MNAPDILVATHALVEALKGLGIGYFIGGSVASSIHGLPRSTLDVDLVADLHAEHVQPLVQQLQEAFYIDADMVRGAVEHQSSFSVIHLDTMIKLDIFMLKSTPYDQGAFARAQEKILDLVQAERAFIFASAEDIILHKLSWYKLGGQVSERQWNDVVGVLRVQATALDQEYMKQWASALQVSSLLQRALEDAGLSSVAPDEQSEQ